MTTDFTKRLYLENTKDWEAELSKKRFSDQKLGVTVVEKGIVLPAQLLPAPNPSKKYSGGVCDKDFNFVAGDREKQNNWATIDSAYTVDRKDITYLDEDVIYGGALIDHFGHFLTESQSRLWFILQDLQVNGGGGIK